MTTNDATPPDTARVETLAALAHDQWSDWMEYLFKQCNTVDETDRADIPPELVARWWRQMRTPYADLPEGEKESDRVEARKVLAVLAAEGERVRELEADIQRLRNTARAGLRPSWDNRLPRWDHALHVIADGVDVVPGPPCWCHVCSTARQQQVATTGREDET